MLENNVKTMMDGIHVGFSTNKNKTRRRNTHENEILKEGDVSASVENMTH